MGLTLCLLLETNRLVKTPIQHLRESTSYRRTIGQNVQRLKMRCFLSARICGMVRFRIPSYLTGHIPRCSRRILIANYSFSLFFFLFGIIISSSTFPSPSENVIPRSLSNGIDSSSNISFNSCVFAANNFPLSMASFIFDMFESMTSKMTSAPSLFRTTCC